MMVSRCVEQEGGESDVNVEQEGGESDVNVEQEGGESDVNVEQEGGESDVNVEQYELYADVTALIVPPSQGDADEYATLVRGILNFFMLDFFILLLLSARFKCCIYRANEC